MQPGQKEIKLIKACLKGKRGAQKSFYKIYHGYALSICMRYATSREDAVEMMNDGFLKVFKYLERFDQSKLLKPWLRRLMINSALDHLKKYEQKMEAIAIEKQLRNLVSDTRSDAITYEELLDMVRMLPPAYRKVFNLYAIEGYKHEEIAQMLGISVGTSKSNYHKSKQKLRGLLSEYFGVNK